MGRITIFTSDDVHSALAQAALRELNIPFTAISIVDHPHKHNDVYKLTTFSSSPQVFFNTRHIGGLRELIDELQIWRDCPVSPQLRYQQHIAVYPDPKNAVFHVPDSSISGGDDDTTRRMRVAYKAKLCVKLPDGTTTSVVYMTEKLRNSVPKSVVKHKGVYYRNAFDGATLVKNIKLSLELTSDETVAFCQHLLDEQLIVCVSGSSKISKKGGANAKNISFDASNDVYYRLYCDHQPSVLNSYTHWSVNKTHSDTQPRSASPSPSITSSISSNNSSCGSSSAASDKPLVNLLAELDKMMYAVEIDNLSTSDGYVDYTQALKHEQYHMFEYAVCELQTYSVDDVADHSTKIACCLNITILMLKYAFYKLGVVVDESTWRQSFWKHVKFNVGGHVYSFQSWTDKVLRTTTRTDYRAILALYVGSHMGSTVSTPFRLYTSALLDTQLDTAARVFFEDKTNMCISSNSSKHVRVSKVVSWYKSDFGRTDGSILAILSEYTQGSTKLAIDRMTGGGGSIGSSIVSSINVASKRGSSSGSSVASGCSSNSSSVINSSVNSSVTNAAGCKISFLDVDMTRNARSYVVYEESTIQGDVKGLRKLLMRFQVPRMPPNEQLRLDTLRGMNILDSIPEERFDRITLMVKEHFNMPFVFISLVDENRQWFKSKQWGADCEAICETPREVSFCGHTILLKSEDILCIPDLTKDDRFADNPQVAGLFMVRFYAGCAISVKADNGEDVNIGTLCLLDLKPREFSQADADALKSYARLVKKELVKQKGKEVPISLFSPGTARVTAQ